MRSLEIRRTASAKVGFTADQWQLFDEPGRDEAAADLNRTLQEAINAPDATAASVRAAMRPVQRRHDMLGADDGEAEGLIERAVDAAFG